MFRITSMKDDLEAAQPPPPPAATDQHAGGRLGGGVAFAPPHEPSRLKSRLQKLWRQMGAGTAPYDDSLGEPTTNDSRSSDNGSVFARQRDTSIGFVDAVVVQNQAPHSLWGIKGSGGPSEPTGTNRGTHTGVAGGLAGSEAGSGSYREDRDTGFGGPIGRYCRWRIWPKVATFFNPRFIDDEPEETYQRELWYSTKVVHILGACFLVLIWILTAALLPHPFSQWNKVANYCLGPIFCIPLLPMAAMNFPRRGKLYYVWQVQCVLAMWITSYGYLIDMRICGYYTDQVSCGNRDFISLFFYATGPPAVGLFALGQSRAFACGGCICFFAIACATILPVRVSFVRNLINLLVYYAFMIAASYQREVNDRRLFTMRAELKVQFRAKQRAEINERKTQDSKRRFSSYIFHEVRVPLNTALLAVQNLEGANVFDRNSEQAIEYAALEGSLQMMSQVLNDVLDFNRMERGGFSSVSRPFSLHAVMNSIFVPLKLEANSRGLALNTELDPKIDEFAERASSKTGELEGPVAEGDGLVMGDEMRLRQVINNLTSNAAKFTSAGGSITVRTRLIFPNDSYASTVGAPTTPGVGDSVAGDPHLDSGMSGATLVSPTPSPLPEKLKPDEITIPVRPNLQHGLSTRDLHAHNATGCTEGELGQPIVVRFEVTDTGGGIRPKDMEENRLFSAYVQTEIGRNQGGKGTGLGLSLVRQIVMLSGGRLGVRSRAGEGSTFWVEMPFRVGPLTHATDVLEPHRRVSSTRCGDASSYMPSSAYSDTTSEYRWGTPSLKQQQSDLGLQKIDEGVAVEMQEVVSASSISSYRQPHRPGSESGDYFSSSTTNTPRPASPVSPPPPTPLPPAPLSPTPLSPTSTLISSPPTSPNPPPVRPLPHAATSSQSTVPSTRSISSSAIKPASKALEFPDGPLNVLVVDDDALTRRLMSRLMTRLGCNVSTAENGLLGLEAIVEQREGTTGTPRNFDLVLLDNNMPVMSGLGVVTRLREMGRTDLVVGVTANALLSDQEEYIEKGASYVLTKPVLEADLRRFCVVADAKRRVEVGPLPTSSTSTDHPSLPSQS